MNVGRYLRGEDRHVGTARTTQPQPPQRTEQEPVACPNGESCKHGAWCTESYCQEHCEFRAPPASKPLTDEEISEIAINNPPMVHEFARAIEAAHGIKENT